MSTARVIARNIFSNWMGFGVQIIIAFALTPFVLHRLGDTRYGVWMLVMSITGYYGLLDLGFRSGLTQYLTRYLATEDYDRMNVCASTAIAILGTLGGGVGLASLVIAWLATVLFTLVPGTQHEVSACVLVIGASTALQFVFFPFSSVFVAAQHSTSPMRSASLHAC